MTFWKHILQGKCGRLLSVLQSLRKSSSQFSCDTDVSAQKCAHPLQVFSVYWGCCFWKARLQASMGGDTNVYACVCMLYVVVHSCRMFVWSILPLRTKEKLRKQDDKMSRLRKRTVRETFIARVVVISDEFKSNKSFIYFLYLRCCCSSKSVNRAAILTYYSNESWSLCSPAAQMSINSY